MRARVAPIWELEDTALEVANAGSAVVAHEIIGFSTGLNIPWNLIGLGQSRSTAWSSQYGSGLQGTNNR